jgi:hypothetical protein
VLFGLKSSLEVGSTPVSEDTGEFVNPRYRANPRKCGQRTVRTKSRGDSLCNRILPPPGRPRQAISARRAPWHGPEEAVRSDSPHPRPLGSVPKLTWVGPTDTIDRTCEFSGTWVMTR